MVLFDHGYKIRMSNIKLTVYIDNITQFTCRKTYAAVFCIENRVYSTSEVQHGTNKTHLHLLVSCEYSPTVPKIVEILFQLDLSILPSLDGPHLDTRYRQ